MCADALLARICALQYGNARRGHVQHLDVVQVLKLAAGQVVYDMLQAADPLCRFFPLRMIPPSSDMTLRVRSR